MSTINSKPPRRMSGDEYIYEHGLPPQKKIRGEDTSFGLVMGMGAGMITSFAWMVFSGAVVSFGGPNFGDSLIHPVAGTITGAIAGAIIGARGGLRLPRD